MIFGHSFSYPAPLHQATAQQTFQQPVGLLASRFAQGEQLLIGVSVKGFCILPGCNDSMEVADFAGWGLECVVSLC
jgi:hypothetical protein